MKKKKRGIKNYIIETNILDDRVNIYDIVAENEEEMNNELEEYLSGLHNCSRTLILTEKSFKALKKEVLKC